MIPSISDWSIQAFFNTISNNAQRFVTSLFGGLGVSFIQFELLIAILKLLWTVSFK